VADRYWRGGNWNDTANWSATQGGAGGASVPTSADNVYWHNDPASATYTIDVAANCLDFDFTGATNSPTINKSAGLSIYGSFTIPAGVTFGTGNTFTFKATTPGKTITCNGVAINTALTFDGIGGEWTFQDAINTGTSTISLTNGSLNTNGVAVNCGTLSSSNSNVRSLSFGNSLITCIGSFGFTDSANLTFNAGQSKIIINAVNRTFAGGGQVFCDLESQETMLTVSGNNTFRDLKCASGKTIKLTANSNQTTETFHLDGAIVQSTIEGTPAIISCASGTITMTSGSLKDITATGGATFNAVGVTDLGGNSGWNFVEPASGRFMTCNSKFW
jgi:hypothetical protein